MSTTNSSQIDRLSILKRVVQHFSIFGAGTSSPTTPPSLTDIMSHIQAIENLLNGQNSGSVIQRLNTMDANIQHIIYLLNNSPYFQ